MKLDILKYPKRLEISYSTHNPTDQQGWVISQEGILRQENDKFNNSDYDYEDYIPEECRVDNYLIWDNVYPGELVVECFKEDPCSKKNEINIRWAPGLIDNLELKDEQINTLVSELKKNGYKDILINDMHVDLFRNDVKNVLKEEINEQINEHKELLKETIEIYKQTEMNYLTSPGSLDDKENLRYYIASHGTEEQRKEYLDYLDR